MPGTQVRPVKETINEYLRGLAGGIVFSIAALYTMEIWWQGYTIPPWRMLVAGFLVFLALFAFTYYVGLHENKSFGKKFLETLETVALGTLLSTVILLLAGQLSVELSLYEWVTRIAAEGAICSMGIAIGASQLGGDRQKGGGDSEEIDKREGSITHEVAFAVLGCLILTSGIGPTEEIAMIAYECSPLLILLSIFFTIGLTYGISTHAQSLSSSRVRCAFAGGNLGDAVTTYAIALLTCASIRWITSGFVGVGTEIIIAQSVILAVPGGVGAGAGRILLK